MPRVPVYTADQAWVQPNEAQLRAPDISTGLGDLSQGLSHVADATNQIVQMSSETQARAQALQDSQALSKLTAQYQTLQGQNAVDARSDTLKQIENLQKQGMASMGTPLMQRYYTMHAAPIFAGASDAVNGHAIQQTHVAYGQQLSAERSAAQDAAVGLYTDPDKFGAALPIIASKARSEAIFAGLGDENGAAVTEYVKNKVGESVQSAIRTALAQDVTASGVGGVDLAMAINKRYGGENLPFAIRQQVDAEMAEPLLNRHAIAIVNAAKAGSTEQPTKDDNGNWIVPKVAVPTPGSDATAVPGPITNYQMPVGGGHITDDYAAHLARGSAGVDIAVPVNTPIKAVAVGTVIKAVPNGQDDSGNYVMVRHPDGMISSYAHMGNVSVKEGDDVNANTVLGTVGLTGHTTGAHVHLRMRDADGNDVDPMSVLGGKPGTVAAVTAPGQVAVPDEAKTLANIDAMGLPPEMAALAKKVASEQFHQVRTAQSYSEEQAKESVNGWIANYQLAHAGNWPPPSAVPSSMWNNISPDQAAIMKESLMDGIRKQADKAQSDAQSTNYANMQIQMYLDPNSFAQADPSSWIGKVSAGQWNELRVRQAQIKAEQNQPPKPFDSYKATSNAVGTFSHFNDGILPKLPAGASDDQKAEYSRQMANVYEAVRAGAENVYAHAKRPPTTDEMQALVRNAVQAHVTTPGGWFSSSTTIPAFQMTGSQVPKNIRATITKALQATGNPNPTDADIVREYMRQVGRGNIR